MQFNLEAFLDQRKPRGRDFVVLLVCGLVMFVDGFDTFMIGKIAPAIAHDFGKPVSGMTLVFVLQQVGLAVATFAISPLADRFGRRTMLLVLTASFGTITLATLLCESMFQFAVMRGIGGVFMGGVLPVVVALISESTPRRRRSTFIAISMSAYSTGSAASGGIAAWLVNDYGWEIGFWIGGLLPLVCVPLIALWVPESLKYLADRNPTNPAIAGQLKQMEPTLPLRGDEVFVLGSAVAGEKARFMDVFLDGRALGTTLIWLSCFFSIGNIVLLSAWLPSFFQEMAGIPISRFAVLVLIAFAGGLVGTLSIGYLMDRLNGTGVLALYYLMLAAALFAMGQVPFGTTFFLPILIVWSFCQSGGQVGINTLMAHFYPPRMRSTGIGWGGGAGRIGGIVAPLFGGFALASQMSLQQTMTAVAVSPVCVAVLLYLLGRSASFKHSADQIGAVVLDTAGSASAPAVESGVRRD